MPTIQEQLYAMQDAGYRDFHAKLIPAVPIERIIGVRTPALRQFAKQITSTPEAHQFLNALLHATYDENNLHAFLIETIKDYEQAMYRTEQFLPYIDNWATCDLFSPKIFKKNHEKVLEKIRAWIASDHEYTVRYGIGLLLSNYLDEQFQAEHLALAASAKHDVYYIDMMLAWYFSVALIKQPDDALPWIQEHRLRQFVHNKAIQKACESYRISDEMKKELKQMKR